MTTELTIVKKNGGAYIDSRQVAEAIGKRHYDLLRDIGRYAKYLYRAIDRKIAFNDFFVESSYVDGIGRTLPCYLCNRSGCELIAHKLTGERGVLFSAAYIRKFHEYEDALREQEIKVHNRPRLSEFNGAVRNVLDGMSYCLIEPDRVMGFLRGVYEPLGVKVLTDGKNHGRAHYTVTQIADMLEVYSETGRPHGLAIAAIISKLNIPLNCAAVVPYGLVGVSVRYNSAVVETVRNWLADNNYPRDIPHLNFAYHIFYRRPNQNLLSLFDILDEPIRYTAEELDAMCGKYGDCDDCPGLYTCATHEAERSDDDNDFFFDYDED